MSWLESTSAVVVVAGLLVFAQGYVDYEDMSEQRLENNPYYEDYTYYADETGDTLVLSSYHNESVNRVRRYQHKSKAKTLSPQDIREVRGALKQLLAGVEDNPFTPHTTQSLDYRPTNITEFNNTTTTPSYTTTPRPSLTNLDTEPTTNMTSETDLTMSTLYLLDTLKSIHKKYTLAGSENLTVTKSPTRSAQWTYRIRNNIGRLSSIIESQETNNNKALRDNTVPPNATVPLGAASKRPELDIPRLLAIIADLAQDFETNLTRKLNETLIKMSIPTCSTPTMSTEPTVTDQYDANYTGSIVAKCFVCGMDIPGIPRHAHCADAFAGDFLPLVPVDPSAKGKISRFRKYCTYSNVRGFQYQPNQPRAIYGRWTGGCAVRWIDLSGVYTQRICRSRMQPVLGAHFASKRMAKLERTLWNVEDGCIVSPVATLVPLSRGVSLYARFHACVCTGNWCNSSQVNLPWPFDAILFFIVLLIYYA